MQEFCAAGVCPVSALGLGAHEREWLGRLCPDAQSVLVYLFPYFAGRRPGNLSLYARGRDYHAVIRDALTPVADRLCERHPAHRFAVLADDSPLPEVRAAVLAGLGAAGQNGLLIHETYGSYVVIGTIASSLPIPAAQQLPRACLGCGACVRACPGQALDGRGGMDARRCLSYLTIEHRGELPEGLSLPGRIYGCDICRDVCPLGKGGGEAAVLPALRARPELLALGTDDVLSLGQEDFSALFRRSAVKRAKLAGLQRNARRVRR